jgi:uncharacterized protein (DUF1015 family)
VTPPYDIISKKAQERYYTRHPQNIIRLELGKEEPTDNTINNVYTRAAAMYAQWRAEDILAQDATPCYYLYQQTFQHGGHTYTRTSLLARVRLEPWSTRVVLPHEHTLAKAKMDRLNLYRACATNFSPIMSMYEDPQGRIRRLLSTYTSQPEIAITDEFGEEHRLQPLREAQDIALIQDFFAQRQLYIADGHHRYETALAYQAEILEQRKELHPDDGVNFTLMALIDLDDPGWLVLPTHRLLFNLNQDALDALSARQLARHFTVQELTETNETVLQRLGEAGQHEPSFVLQTANQRLLLRLNEQGRRYMEGSGHSAAWNKTDVALAQRLILEEAAGISVADIAGGMHIRFTHDARQAFQALEDGEVQAALFLNSTPLRQVCEVAQADDRMPQKSTYLYPKLITGLVMNPLW